MLPELRMDSGSPIQTDVAAEEKRRAAVLVRNLDTAKKYNLADDVARMARMWHAGILVDWAGLLCSRRWRPWT